MKPRGFASCWRWSAVTVFTKVEEMVVFKKSAQENLSLIQIVLDRILKVTNEKQSLFSISSGCLHTLLLQIQQHRILSIRIMKINDPLLAGGCVRADLWHPIEASLVFGQFTHEQPSTQTVNHVWCHDEGGQLPLELRHYTEIHRSTWK